jgi:hypothetical protein
LIKIVLMKNTFKTQSIHIFFIKYHITQIKILMVKGEQKRLKKSNWTIILGRS